MQRPANKVDMAEMNTAIDKVLAISPPEKAEQKQQRTQRKAERPPPAMSGKTASKPDGR